MTADPRRADAPASGSLDYHAPDFFGPDEYPGFEQAGKPTSEIGQWLREFADELDRSAFYLDEHPLAITIVRVDGAYRATMMYPDWTDADATRS